jgi:hypothetical protein
MVAQIDVSDLPPTSWVRNVWCPIPRVPSGGKPPSVTLGYTLSPASQVLKPGIMLSTARRFQAPTPANLISCQGYTDESLSSFETLNLR